MILEPLIVGFTKPASVSVVSVYRSLRPSVCLRPASLRGASSAHPAKFPASTLRLWIYSGLNCNCNEIIIYLVSLFILMPLKTRSSESDGRSDVTDCFDLRFVLIALVYISLIFLICLDCPDWIKFP